MNSRASNDKRGGELKPSGQFASLVRSEVSWLVGFRFLARNVPAGALEYA